MNINTEYFTKSPVRKLFIQVKNVNPLINKLDGKLKLSDYIGILKAYLGIRRNSFRINPGIYSLGSPDKTSPVLVTANYKMSVDYLRNAVKDMNVWIMVLDTKGVNVWCAAGKGTFGTDEIINRIKRCNLVKLISHRKIIVPQLGAPGINPVQVKKQSGFSVVYGPVKAKDIPLFIKNDFTASKEMRIKQFNILERIAVSITHLSQGFFYTLGIALFFSIADFIFLPGNFFRTGSSLGINSIISLASLLTSTILTGILLPLLPGRSFSVKGLSIGIPFSIITYYFLDFLSPYNSIIYNSGKIIILLAWIVYSSVNLSGSSTYTSLSGVMKEMSYSIPLIIAGAVIGTALIITGGLLI